MTDNQKYHGRNNRFDRRINRLAKLGYRYNRIEEFGIAVMAKSNHFARKVSTITCEAIMRCNKEDWIELLSHKLKTGSQC